MLTVLNTEADKRNHTEKMDDFEEWSKKIRLKYNNTKCKVVPLWDS